MPTLTLNLDERHDAALEALATEQGMSKTAVLRQALRLYQLVHLRAAVGQQLAFTKDGRVIPLHLPSMLPIEPPAHHPV